MPPNTMMKTTGKMPVPPKTRDSELKGGIESVRPPVVVVRAKKDNGLEARSTEERGDPQQVKRAKKPRMVRSKHWNDNGRVYLTGLDLNTTMDAESFGAFLASLIETADPLDRAHTHRRLVDEKALRHVQESWVFKSPMEIDHPLNKNGRRTGKPLKTTRRRYHPSQLTSRGAAFDSMYDAVHEIASRFQSVGVNLGWVTTKSGEYSAGETDRAKVLAGIDSRAAEAILEPKTTQKMTKEERQLEAAASAILDRKRRK